MSSGMQTWAKWFENNTHRMFSGKDISCLLLTPYS
jgi:hypothetical protein